MRPIGVIATLLVYLFSVPLALQSAIAERLRYDGVYCREDESHAFTDYLRFYRDHTFQYISFGGTCSAEAVAVWFREERHKGGRYVVRGKRIRVVGEPWN